MLSGIVQRYFTNPFPDPFVTHRTIAFTFGRSGSVNLLALKCTQFTDHLIEGSRKNITLCATMAIMLIARVAFGLATVSFLLKFKTVDAFGASREPLISLTCGLGLATIVDLMVSISLVYYRLKVPRRADQFA